MNSVRVWWDILYRIIKEENICLKLESAQLPKTWLYDSLPSKANEYSSSNGLNYLLDVGQISVEAACQKFISLLLNSRRLFMDRNSEGLQLLHIYFWPSVFVHFNEVRAGSELTLTSWRACWLVLPHNTPSQISSNSSLLTKLTLSIIS